MKLTMKYLLLSIITCITLAACDGDEPTEENIAKHLNQGASSDSSDDSSSTDDTNLVVTVEDTFSFSLSLRNSAGNSTVDVNTANPVKVSATLLLNEEPQAGVLIEFSSQYGLVDIDPVIGTALTDANGVASIIITAGEQSGADTIWATTDDLDASINVSVSTQSTSVSMSAAQALPSTISATGTTVVSVSIEDDDNGGLYTAPVSVSFTSACVEAGLAEIESPIVTLNGSAQSTYKDIACGQEDTIEVNAQVGSQLLASSAIINVQDATAGSINFISATSEYIALEGTGGSGGGIGRSETSVLTFQVMDVTGNPAAFEDVMFELSTTAGEITLNYSNAQTDSQGMVSVIVQSGSVATSVRVIARLTSNNSLSTISDLLVVSSGVADQNSFSLSVSNFNPEAWLIDGAQVQVNAYVADHFNNPVPDGTVISFSTEFGQVEPSCITEDGHCSVMWTSSAPRVPNPPFRNANTQTRYIGDSGTCLSPLGLTTGLNAAGYPCFYDNASAATALIAAMPGGLGQVYGNRVTIFAHMIGEESFSDTNGNGEYDSGEAFTDIPAEVFRDENEDGVFSGQYGDGSLADGAQAAIDACLMDTGVVCLQNGGDNEEYVDFNNDGVFNGIGNGQYNGVLCKDESKGCSNDLVPISQNITILQSGSWANISIIEQGLSRNVVANYFLTVDITGGAKTIISYVADLHNGRMPSGTKIEYSTSVGEIVGPSSCTVLNSSALGFEQCSVVVKPVDDLDASEQGPLIVKVTSPSGAVTEKTIQLQQLVP